MPKGKRKRKPLQLVLAPDCPGIDPRIYTLTRHQVNFLRLCCTQMTYEEIADVMAKGARTIDGYREQCFSILNLKNRAGLILFAIQNGLVDVKQINLYE